MELAIFVGCCIAFDVITGIMKGAYKGDINSTAIRQGLFHKASEVLTMIGAWLIQQNSLRIGLGFEAKVYAPIAIYIGIMEIISVIENICEINPSLAKLLKPYLKKLQAAEKEEEENEKR